MRREAQEAHGANIVFRSRGVIAEEAVIAFLCSFVGWGIASSVFPSPWVYLFLLFALAATALAVARAFRISVVMNQSGVVVKNYWRTFELAWTDISSIRSTWTTMGPFPTRSLAIVSAKRRLFARVLASAGGKGERQRNLATMLRQRPELASIPFDS